MWHMITLRQEDLKEPSSSSRIEGWACEEESNKGLPTGGGKR